MVNLISFAVIAIPLGCAALPAFAAEPPVSNSSTTIIGGNEPNPQHDVAAGLSNLCAGYVGLRQFELAIKNCSDSLAINDSNWRTWNNRAAAHLGKGMYDAALQDVESGLERAPESFTLKKTRAIVRSYDELFAPLSH